MHSRVQVPLGEHDGFVVGEELELNMGAGNVWQQVPALRMVCDGPDQNPVPENLQEEGNRSESVRTDAAAEDMSVFCVFSRSFYTLKLEV